MDQPKTTRSGETYGGDNQQMINQNIIYAPQIIFMQKGGQNGEQDKFFVGGDKRGFYYYDPQRIEKSNLPIFKTERMLMNRPGYQQMLTDKYITREREQQRENQQAYESLPGRDQDFQAYMMPQGFEPAIADTQL